METIDSLVAKAGTILAARNFDIDTNTSTDRSVIEYEVKRAINEINRCRRFTPSGEVLYDEKYEDLIIPLVLSAFAKVGAEGQTSHSENGVTRNYTVGGDYPKDELSKITPLIK